MRAATWFRVDRELGKNVRGRDIFVPLVLSLIFAFLLGNVIEFGFLVAIEAGQGAVILVLDWMAMFASALPGLLAGYFAARAGLRAGVFGYFPCLLFGVALIGGVSMLAISGPAGDIAAALGISLHFGILYGVLWGTLFWRCLLYGYPEFRPPAFGVGILLSAILVAAWSTAYWFVLADRWLT